MEYKILHLCTVHLSLSYLQVCLNYMPRASLKHKHAYYCLSYLYQLKKIHIVRL